LLEIGADSVRSHNTIGVFGDSIAFGQGVSIHRGWVTQVSKWIDENYGTKWQCSNHSVNGSTTRTALERMPYEIQSLRPKLLIMQFGLNDCNYWVSDKGLPRVSPDAFRANLVEIYERALVFGAETVFILTNHPTRRAIDFSHAPVSYEQSNGTYNQIIREVSLHRPKLELIDAFQEITHDGQNLKHLLEDGLHLSPSGHDKYFELVSTKLQKVLNNLVDSDQ